MALGGCAGDDDSPPPASDAPSLTARDCRISFVEKRPGVRLVRRDALALDPVTWPGAGDRAAPPPRHPGATWTLVKLHHECASTTVDPTHLIEPVLEGPEKTSGYGSYDMPASQQKRGEPVRHDQWLLARMLPGSRLIGFQNTAGDQVNLDDVPTVGGPTRSLDLAWIDR